MSVFFLFFSCASDIKIAPRQDSAVFYGLELSPQSYDIVAVPIQNEYSFDFSLFSHEKTTIHQIAFSNATNSDIWSIHSFLEPPITLSAGSKMNFTIHVIPPSEGIFEEELQITSSREDWNVPLQIEGIAP